jgi:transposase
LRRALLEAAWAATRKKNSSLRAFFFRLMYRKGWGKAIVALGHKLLVIAYEMMKTRTPYDELGADYYDQLNPEKTIQRLVQRLGKLGVEVAITPIELRII